MTIRIFAEGNDVMFICNIGYKNKKGVLRYDVRAGTTGKIVHVDFANSNKAVYSIELHNKKTLTGSSVIENIPGDLITTYPDDIITEVSEFPRKPKKHRPWRKFSTEQLEYFAKKNKITWKKNENPKVNRMFLVQALSESGVEVPDEIEVKITKTVSKTTKPKSK